jgi:hypothetical protein
MNEYEQQANTFAKKHGVKLTTNHIGFKKHFPDDLQKRHVFECKLTRNGKRYTFTFGQSLVNGDTPPSMYDVLTCLEKYTHDTFSDYCEEYGYDKDSLRAMQEYKAVEREAKAVHRLFGDVLEELCEIQ